MIDMADESPWKTLRAKCRALRLQPHCVFIADKVAQRIRGANARLGNRPVVVAICGLSVPAVYGQARRARGYPPTLFQGHRILLLRSREDAFRGATAGGMEVCKWCRREVARLPPI